jgi:RNA recognition motif-containing protein
MSVKIFIGGFPLDSSELELVQLVSPYAEVETIKIVRDKISKKCKGYAFIELSDEPGADRVIDALDGTLLAGKPLTINKVADEPLKPAPAPFKPKRPRIHK